MFNVFLNFQFCFDFLVFYQFLWNSVSQFQSFFSRFQFEFVSTIEAERVAQVVFITSALFRGGILSLKHGSELSATWLWFPQKMPSVKPKNRARDYGIPRWNICIGKPKVQAIRLTVSHMNVEWFWPKLNWIIVDGRVVYSMILQIFYFIWASKITQEFEKLIGHWPAMSQPQSSPFLTLNLKFFFVLCSFAI